MIEERECEWCGEMYRPRVPDQRFCGMECRNAGKAAEGRAARKVWFDAGRPVFNEAIGEPELKVANRRF
jgi:hypothetical protein